MNSTQQKIYKLISVFLEYPEYEWMEGLPELREEIASFENPIFRTYFEQFLNYLEYTPWEEVCEQYVNTFDYHGVVSLHLTFHVFKDSRERGEALVKLRQLFRESDVEMDTTEMPDYLPMVLEFLAIAEDEHVKRMLKLHLKSIIQLEKVLAKQDSPYSFLLKACIENSRYVLNEMHVS